MPEPSCPPPVAASTDRARPTSPTADGRRRWSNGLWYLGRALVIGGLIVWAASPFGADRSTVFAEPNAQWQTPTPTVSSWYPAPINGAATPTPTPFGWNPQQNGQYVNGGAVNQPGATYPNESVQSPT